MKRLALLLLASTAAAAPDAVRTELDVDYLGPGRAEKADLYLPAQAKPGQRFPAVVIIHGGGWGAGDKRAAREINIGTTLARNGYVGMSINYRLATAQNPSPAWPQNLHDCKTAVRWLRANAERLQVDPERIGAIGGSAGGHLATMLALTGPELDPPGSGSCAIRCAVDLYGPVLWFNGRDLPMFRKTRAEAPELYRQASPLAHVDPADPAMLILHGTADGTVPVADSEALADALKKAGVEHELVIVPGAPHSFHLEPKQRDLRPLVLGFFDKHLKPSLAVMPGAAVPRMPDAVDEMAQGLEPAREIVYKKVGERELRLFVFQPEEWKAGDRRPCFVTIHGGGWTGLSPRRQYPVAAHFAKLGMVGISLEYRLVQKGSGTDVFDCVRDARSAVRYVRGHAAELGIDPHKIVVNGGSAGGHLAAATALFDGIDEPGEDVAVSCQPNALVLFFPVIDTSTEGYGNAKIGARWQEISPLHQVRSGVAPTIVFHGTADTVTPFQGAKAFEQAMRAAGNRCELVAHEGGVHGYFMRDRGLFEGTLRRTAAFLESLGFLPASGE